MKVRVLVDRSVFSDGIVGEWISTEHSVTWGKHVVRRPIASMRLKPRLPPDQTDRQAEIDALPTIAKLARDGDLELITYDELRFEGFQARAPVEHTLGDLFAGLHPLHVEPAVDRSFFFGQEFGKYIEKKSVVRFCKLLLSPRFDISNFPTEFVTRLPAVTRTSLRDLKHYRQLCRHAPAKFYPDLFHLWTGRVNGCMAFLTMERKLPNFCHNQIRLPHCNALRPQQLLDMLRVAHREPMPIAPGEVVDYFRAMDPFFPRQM